MSKNSTMLIKQSSFWLHVAELNKTLDEIRDMRRRFLGIDVFLKKVSKSDMDYLGVFEQLEEELSFKIDELINERELREHLDSLSEILSRKEGA